EYPWGSATIIGLFVGSAIALVLFVFAEARAAEPILPLHLFRSSVFSVSVVLAFIVGFAMLGAMTFLPTYLQYVQGVSATDSGVRMLPLVLGLLVTAIGSGVVVSRTGRYKLFPVAGTLVMAIGLYLLSQMNAHTSALIMSVDMLVLGAGIGLCMQVLTIIVQNTVHFSDLGVATSGVTFFRTLGSSFGAAIFGTIYANAIGSRLPIALAQTSGVNPAEVATPKLLHAHPDEQIAPIVAAYADALHVVFLAAVPVALAAFILSLFLKQVPLRDSSRAGASDVGGGFGMPESADSNLQLQSAIARLFRSQRREKWAALRAASGTDLDAANHWCVGQVHLRERLDRDTSLVAIAERVRVPGAVLWPAFAAARDAGYLSGTEDRLAVTESGRAELEKVIATMREWLAAELVDWGAADDARLGAALSALARRLVDDDEQLPPLPAQPALSGGTRSP
ncbi:MAG TPA: MFS transporter, partial [Jatrophihabitans sp.]|nr:MFS transporter [Jatrophihabitans sp.]